jgi:hypothetical protein
MTYFNELNIDMNDNGLFPPAVYERTKENPHESLSIPCHACNDSLDGYVDQFLDELFPALEI